MITLCEIIKQEVNPNFVNMETALKTYDRNALVCGIPAWRYAYHAIHSADKWFINPFDYIEPDFHEHGMDRPQTTCETGLSDDQLIDYLLEVQRKTLLYLDTLTDDDLYYKPVGCPYTRFELVLRQFRHLSYHTGMINGLTAEKSEKIPVYVTSDSYYRLDKGLFASDDNTDNKSGNH